MPRTNRRAEILEAFAAMLETSAGRVTTAALAAKVGVSEAALYRHFPSKAKMLEGLIDFAEDALFPRITQIIAREDDAAAMCRATMLLTLSFAEKNPWFARLAMGDASLVETERLKSRMSQLFDRMETQFRQIIRDAFIATPRPPVLSNQGAANLLVTVLEGRIHQFVRSDFKRLPTEGWNEQWETLTHVLFDSPPVRYV